MRILKQILYTLSFIFVAGLMACNKNVKDNGNAGNEADRKSLLVNMADNIILPSYKSFQTALASMAADMDQFSTSPDATTLSAARTSWKQAYIVWQKVEMFDFGPSANNRNFYNVYPCDAGLLESFISSGSYNLDALSNNKVQGFPALDYLLNHAEDAAILAEFTTDAQASSRKKYLSDVLTMMQSKLAAVIIAWQGDYYNTFVGDAGTGAGSPLSLMTNEYIMYMERFVRSGKYGIPAGVLTGTPVPENVEAYYSHTIGAELAQTAILALKDAFKGTSFDKTKQGPSYYTYLQSLAATNANAASLAEDILKQFDTIDAKNSALGTSIYQAVLSNRTAVLEVYDALQTEVRYLKVDMTSAIGISITYTDNDGD